MKYIHWLCAIFLLLFTGCTSSKITTSWKAPAIKPQQYNKILVLALIHDKDRSLQQKMEQHAKTFNNIDEQQALEKIKNSAVDAVLTIILLDKERIRNY